MALTAFDRDLLKRCLAREPGAWKDFVDRFMGLIVHVIRHTAQSRSIEISPEDVDDLCAEILLSLVANDFAILRNFRGRSSLATYLTVVARRIGVRLLMRRQASRPAIVAAASVSATTPSASQQMADQEQLHHMLEGLGRQEAEVVRLFHLEGKSYRQISSELHIPENSIGPILSRARAKMRRTAQQQPQ